MPEIQGKEGRVFPQSTIPRALQGRQSEEVAGGSDGQPAAGSSRQGQAAAVALQSGRGTGLPRCSRRTDQPGALPAWCTVVEVSGRSQPAHDGASPWQREGYVQLLLPRALLGQPPSTGASGGGTQTAASEGDGQLSPPGHRQGRPGLQQEWVEPRLRVPFCQLCAGGEEGAAQGPASSLGGPR